MAIKTVWVAEGCTGCGACADIAPDVFAVDSDAGSCSVKGDVRADGKDSTNEAEKSPLKADAAAANDETIRDAATSCPAEVIQFQE